MKENVVCYFLREVGELQEELDEGVWTHVLLFRKVFTKIVETQNKHVQIRDQTETNKKDNKLNYRKLKTFVLASYLSRSRAAWDMSLLTSSMTCHSSAVGEGRSRIESTRSSRRFLSSFLKNPIAVSLRPRARQIALKAVLTCTRAGAQ